MDRKDFLKKALILTGSLGLSFFISGSCEQSKSSTESSNEYNITISANHGHSFTITQADVDTASDKIYNIHGAADHGHQVTITAADFLNLKNSSSISETSTLFGHTHLVTVSRTSAFLEI